MVALDILEKAFCSAWDRSTFIIPIPNGTVCMVSDAGKLNANLIRKPHPIPKIPGIIQKLEGFQYTTVLNLSMGHYSIHLETQSQEMYTIIIQWGKYEYLRLPMCIKCAPDIFKKKCPM